MNRRAVFLDRDGVINHNVYYADTGEWESPRKVADFALMEGVLAALASLQRAEFLLFVVSNQPSFAKGKTSLADLRAIHNEMQHMLSASGIQLTEAYYCFHHPEGTVPELAGPCECRKPSPHFLLAAACDYGIELPSSWMIGDRDTDIECGQAAGVQTIRVKGDHPSPVSRRVAPEFHAAALPDAAAVILRECRPTS